MLVPVSLSPAGQKPSEGHLLAVYTRALVSSEHRPDEHASRPSLPVPLWARPHSTGHELSEGHLLAIYYGVLLLCALASTASNHGKCYEEWHTASARAYLPAIVG